MTGWNTITFQTGTVENRERLTEKIEYYSEDEKDGVRVSEGFTVKCVFFGYGDIIEQRILKQNQHLWERACLMKCNDTTDSANGTIYESSGNPNNIYRTIEYSNGDELMHGLDVKKELSSYMNTDIFMR